MENKKRLKILNKFINQHSIARSGGIEVLINSSSIRFLPKDNKTGARYEDSVLLSNIILGAQHLLFYLARNNYDIIKKKNNAKITKKRKGCTRKP